MAGQNALIIAEISRWSTGITLEWALFSLAVGVAIAVYIVVRLIREGINADEE